MTPLHLQLWLKKQRQVCNNKAAPSAACIFVMIYISSSENTIIKNIKTLSKHSGREKSGLALLEGQRFVLDSVRYGARLQALFIKEGYTGKIPPCDNVYTLSPSLFDKISETKTPQGIMATAKISYARVSDIAVGGTILICDNIRDPGNLGTLIRTAHAVGASGIILLKGCVDPFNPKTMRATMGSVFCVPICSSDSLYPLCFLDEQGYEIVGSALGDQSEFLFDKHFTGKTAIVVGNEGDGISDEVLRLCHTKLIIPMPGGAESLNASVAGSILLYEVLRSENNKLD